MVVFTWREMEGERTADRHFSSQKELGTVPHKDEDEIHGGILSSSGRGRPKLELQMETWCKALSPVCFSSLLRNQQQAHNTADVLKPWLVGLAVSREHIA
jgi:uncharacterized protein YeaO (DUF488 family)